MLQTTVIDMEWNTKWDWENLDIFSSKAVAITSPKKLQSTDWEINEKEETDNSFNLSGNNSSTKSSITESSLKNNMKVSNFSFEDSRTFHDTHKKEKEFAGSEPNGSPPSFEASVCSPDQSIGLKLGKRTYFENNTKTSSSPNVPVSTVKKAKLSHQSTPVTRCQVEGCNLDLSSSKEYHRKHKVCEIHSKSLKVVVAGLERRFCQQCSRFHGLPEFDGKKRSCRRRLSDHNARRRKPQQETIQFNSTTLSSSFYDGQQQLSFVLNNVPLAQTKPTVWETRSNCQHSVIPTEKTGLQFPNFNRVLPSKAGVFDQGSNAEALDLRRALSLLSNGSWGSCESDFSGLDQPIHTNGPTMAHHGLPPDYWQLNHHSVDHATGFQESNHVLKPPYGIQYVNPMDEFLKPL